MGGHAAGESPNLSDHLTRELRPCALRTTRAAPHDASARSLDREPSPRSPGASPRRVSPHGTGAARARGPALRRARSRTRRLPRGAGPRRPRVGRRSAGERDGGAEGQRADRGGGHDRPDRSGRPRLLPRRRPVAQARWTSRRSARLCSNGTASGGRSLGCRFRASERGRRARDAAPRHQRDRPAGTRSRATSRRLPSGAGSKARSSSMPTPRSKCAAGWSGTWGARSRSPSIRRGSIRRCWSCQRRFFPG